MLDIKRSKWDFHEERLVGTGLTIANEGSCLVDLLQDGVAKVQESSGTAAEIFVGFSTTTNISSTRESVVEEIVTGAAGAVQLKFGNISSKATDEEHITGVNLTEGQLLNQAATAVADNTYTVVEATGAILTHTGEFNDLVRWTYFRDLTAQEAIDVFYEGHTNNEAHLTYNQVGVIMGSSKVFTDQYDHQIDWSSIIQSDIVTGDGTTGGNPGEVSDIATSPNGDPSSTMMQVFTPTIDVPFLGVVFSGGGHAN